LRKRVARAVRRRSKERAVFPLSPQALVAPVVRFKKDVSVIYVARDAPLFQEAR